MGSHDTNVKHIGGNPKAKKRMGNHLDDIADRWRAIGDPGPSLTLTLRVKRYDIGLALRPALDGAPCVSLAAGPSELTDTRPNSQRDACPASCLCECVEE